MENDCYFWFNANHTSLYIDPLLTSMGLSIFDDSITQVLLAVPSQRDGNGTSSAFDSRNPMSQIEDTIYNNLIGMKYGQFLDMPREMSERNLYEYQLILSSGIKIRNLGSGLLMTDISLEFINLSLGSILENNFNSKHWDANRFYRILDGVIQPTEHFTDNAMQYICGLFSPEIFE